MKLSATTDGQPHCSGDARAWYGRGIIPWLLVLVLCWVGRVGAQPQPDDAWVSVRLMTTQGTPLLPMTGVTVELKKDPAVARAVGFATPDPAGKCFIIVALRAGKYLLNVSHKPLGIQHSQTVELRGGENDLEVRLPLNTLAVQCTLNGVPVTPRLVSASRRPGELYPTEVALPLARLPEEGLVLDGLPVGDSEIILLTEMGYALVKVTVPEGTASQPITVPLMVGGPADIALTDLDGRVMANTPLVYYSADLGRMPLLTDADGKVMALHLPVGPGRVETNARWITAQQIYRSTSVAVLVKANAPAEALCRLTKRQTLTGRCTVDGAAVTPTAGVFLIKRGRYNTVTQEPATWEKGLLRVNAFFATDNRVWLLTELGYATLTFPLSIEQLTVEKTFMLETDGGVIDVVFEASEGAAVAPGICRVRGRLPRQLEADPPVEFPLPVVAAGHWCSPQLPPGEWTITTTGSRALTETVMVRPNEITSITLTPE